MINSWIYDNAEVIKTGRVASKVLKSGKRDVMIEVTPFSSTMGIWKKWVRDIDLYEITNSQDIDIQLKEQVK